MHPNALKRGNEQTLAGNTVNIAWDPGHMGVESNEMVEELTRAGYAVTIDYLRLFSAFKYFFKQWTIEERLRSWKS